MTVIFMMAFLAGAARTVSRCINAKLSSVTSVMSGAFWNYLVGTACAIAALVVAGERLNEPVAGILPRWAYLGGPIGLAFVALSNFVIPRLSAFAMTILVFLGQIGTGLILDAVTDNAMSDQKAIGAMLVLVGLGIQTMGEKVRAGKNIGFAVILIRLLRARRVGKGDQDAPH